jgi:hypothetical protein
MLWNEGIGCGYMMAGAGAHGRDRTIILCQNGEICCCASDRQTRQDKTRHDVLGLFLRHEWDGDEGMNERASWRSSA